MTDKDRNNRSLEPTLASKFLRVSLGFMLLFGTVGLTTCQSFFSSFTGDNNALPRVEYSRTV